MRNVPLDIYDDMPQPMKAYISHFGFHFNKKAFEFAVSVMRIRNASGKEEKITPWSKQEVENLLDGNKIRLENNKGYDAAFVANMAKADYFGSSITDEAHLAKYVKDYLDDPDASDDVAFRRWLATMVGNGEPVDFEDFL